MKNARLVIFGKIAAWRVNIQHMETNVLNGVIAMNNHATSSSGALTASIELFFFNLSSPAKKSGKITGGRDEGRAAANRVHLLFAIG